MTSKSHSSSKLLGTALAAATTTGHGALVQITLTGNQISAFGGDTLNTDLTGDGVDDLSPIFALSNVNPPQMSTMILIGSTPSGAPSYSTIPGSSGFYTVSASIDGYRAGAGFFVDSFFSPISTFSNAPATGGPEGGINLTFTDSNLFGGALTSAFLEVIADGPSASLTLTRLVFDDGQGAPVALNAANINGNSSIPEFSPIPEPSGLALLALGAGGISLRRKRKALR